MLSSHEIPSDLRRQPSHLRRHSNQNCLHKPIHRGLGVVDLSTGGVRTVLPSDTHKDQLVRSVVACGWMWRGAATHEWRQRVDWLS